MKKKILLVDDSRTSIFMQKMILREGPYELIEASDGEQAVAKAREERPDLILMDVVMPRMTGVEALRELQRSEQTRSIPVIMVTTRGESDNVEAGRQAGCAGYLTKPIDQDLLLGKVQSLLGS